MTVHVMVHVNILQSELFHVNLVSCRMEGALDAVWQLVSEWYL